jgi:hypothetical protein
MAFPIINSIASFLLKKRIHQMELFLKYPNEVQEELLFSLLKQAENTYIGKKKRFYFNHELQNFFRKSSCFDLRRIGTFNRKNSQRRTKYFLEYPYKMVCKI